MHILVTDVVTCPRCGPAFGLIVLADRLDDRRVREGALGCANCRETYPVHEGVVDLRGGPTPTDQGPPRKPTDFDAERIYRFAALLGVTTGSTGPIAVVTTDPAIVDSLQEHLPEVGVIGVSAAVPEDGVAGDVGMGWLLAGESSLPFRDGALGGVVIAGRRTGLPVREALRAIARGGRLVIDPAPVGEGEAILEDGAELLLEQDGVAVASHPDRR